MKRLMLFLLIAFATCTFGGDATGRGFGGFGGGRSFGGYGGGRSFGGYGGGGFSGGYGHSNFGGSYSGSHTANFQSGFYGRGGSSSYDHTWENAAGASLNTSGTRGFGETRYGGFAAGGSRDTTLTTASGRTYSAERQGGVASGAYGRTIGGASGTVDGRFGQSSWNAAFAGNRYGAMDHYSSFSAASGTRYWSNSYCSLHGSLVRANFGYYNCFHPAWYAAHPGCWYAAGWAAGAAYTAASYADLCGYCGIPASDPPDYDYGSNVIINDNSVTINGVDEGTPQKYSEQATALASAGQAASPPPTEDWKPLGVFALVQGDEKTSNSIYQLAINKDGIIRGNFYDGLMDTTTEVFGSVDKNTQRAAWTIGKKKDRVFEAGIVNLTKPECPCLIHLGPTKSTQMLLVRVDPSKNGN